MRQGTTHSTSCVICVTFSITLLSFDAHLHLTPVNIHINLTFPENRVTGRDSIGLSSFKFSWWAAKKHAI